MDWSQAAVASHWGLLSKPSKMPSVLGKGFHVQSNPQRSEGNSEGCSPFLAHVWYCWDWKGFLTVQCRPNWQALETCTNQEAGRVTLDGQKLKGSVGSWVGPLFGLCLHAKFCRHGYPKCGWHLFITEPPPPDFPCFTPEGTRPRVRKGQHCIAGFLAVRRDFLIAQVD